MPDLAPSGSHLEAPSRYEPRTAPPHETRVGTFEALVRWGVGLG